MKVGKCNRITRFPKVLNFHRILTQRIENLSEREKVSGSEWEAAKLTDSNFY